MNRNRLNAVTAGGKRAEQGWRVALWLGLDNKKCLEKLRGLEASLKVDAVTVFRRYPIVGLSGKFRQIVPPPLLRRTALLAHLYILAMTILTAPRLKADVSVAISMIPHALLARLGALLSHSRFVVCYIGTDLYHHLNHPLSRLLLKPLLRRAAASMVTGENSRKMLEEMGWPANLLLIGRNCYELSDYTPVQGVAHWQHDLLFTGRLVKRTKGLDLLLQAIKAVTAEHPKLRCALAGDGPDRAWLEHRIEELGLINHVFLLGRREDIAALLQSSRVFIMTSAWEGLPTSLVEAFACGVPAIVPGVGDISTIARHLVNSLVVDDLSPRGFSQAITLLLANRQLHRELATGATATGAVLRRESLSLSKATKVWEDLLRLSTPHRGKALRVLHLTVCKKLSQGQRNQLLWEQQAAEGYPTTLHWQTRAFSVAPPGSGVERQLPWLFRAHFSRKLFAWLYLLKEHRNYDVVLMRHLTYDPFLPVFGWLIANRVSVHHAKEEAELRLAKPYLIRGAAIALERLAGWVNLRQVRGVLGVTDEIASYQLSTFRGTCPAGTYANGIRLAEVVILPDERQPEKIHIAFLSGKFAPWHGLDRLLDTAARFNSAGDQGLELIIHLIGRLTASQSRAVGRLPEGRLKVQSHGHLTAANYRRILARCDIGIDSLALDRKGLSEASALKVREYLALGLPVYSASGDTALPDSFPYFRQGPVLLEELQVFALAMKGVCRTTVRDAAADSIDKEGIIGSLLEWLKANVIADRR